jgi:hypothetical protein
MTMPFQVALSVTERTSIPKHWGRFYLPGFQAQAMETATGTGRWGSTTQATVANATATLYEDLASSGLVPVVVQVQRDKVYAPALNTVTEIVVDDIPDVIRRRRPKQVISRAIGVPT